MATPGPRSRLIASAIHLVRERGVEATGLTELVEHSGAARRSIYQHFPGGKLDLIAEATRVAGDALGDALEDVTASPRAVLAAVVAQMSADLVADDFRLGCPVVAAACAPPEAGVVRDAAAAAFESWTARIAYVLAARGLDGGEARSLAGFIVSSVEGALMRARAERSVEPLEQVGEQLGRLMPG